MSESRTLTWLHLSDLHVANPRIQWDADRVLRALKGDLGQLGSEHGLHPDLIFFTGDIAFGQRSQDGLLLAKQFEEAEIFFEEIRGLLQPIVPKEHFFIVPGNHDVNREEVTPQLTAWLDKDASIEQVLKMLTQGGTEWVQYGRRLHAYRQFLSDYGYNHLLEDPERLSFAALREINKIKVGIAGFNTSWSCCREEEKGLLWLGARWQGEALHGKVRNAELRIALTHHPSNWFKSAEDPDFQRNLARDFHVHLHGHEHKGWVTVSEDHLQVAAGACYAGSAKETGYNIVKLHLNKAGEIQHGEVWLRCYDEEGGGWIPKIIARRTDYGGRWAFDRRLEAPSGPSPAPLVPPPSAQDGPEVRGIFGREAEIQRLLRSLDRKRILTLYGMPGIGKTTLIREVHRAKLDSGWQLRPLVVYPETLFQDLFRQLAPALGCRDEIVEPPIALGGRYDFERIARWSKNASPTLIHLEMAHLLFREGRFREQAVADFLLAIAEKAPKARLVLELREEPPAPYFPNEVSETIRVRGLGLEAMRAFFSKPRQGRERSWELGDNAEMVFTRLGGRAQGKGHALPLAMFLLATVAESSGESPVEVLLRHPGLLSRQLEEALFQDLYDHVLTQAERHVLQLCSLYRGEIADTHIERLNIHAGDPGQAAFDRLLRRCLLSSDARQEWYSLHQVIRDLTRGRMDPESEQYRSGHASIAEAWLSRLSLGSRPSLPNVIAASESIYHLLEGERYDRLHEVSDGLLRTNIVPRLREASLRLHGLGRHQENRIVLELCTRLDDTDHALQRFLGEIIQRLEGPGAASALTYFKRAYQIKNDFPAYINNLAGWYLANRQYGNALAILDESRSRGIEDRHLISLRASIFAEQGDHLQAAQIRQQQIQNNSRNPAFYNDEAVSLRSQGKLKEAIQILDLVRNHGIENAYSLVIRASILQESGDERQASEIRQQQIQGKSKNPVFYNEEAIYFYHSGKTEEAISILQQATQLGIEDEVTRHLLERWKPR